MIPRSTTTTATQHAVPASRSRLRRYRQAGAARSGFTLVELLVVIGIIAALIAILLPALAGARSSAQLITCESNLRTLGQAMLLHATDRKGYFPLAGTIDVGGQEQIPDNPQYLSDTGNRYDYYANGAAQNSAAVIAGLPGALAPYLGGASQAPAIAGWVAEDNYVNSPPLRQSFLCPSDLTTANNFAVADGWIAANPTNTSTSPYESGAKWVYCNKGGTYVSGYSSYAFNEEILGWQDLGTPTGTPVVGHSRERGKLDVIPHSSTTMLMCEFKSANRSGFEGNTLGLWANSPGDTLATVYLGTDAGGSLAGSGAFDLVRHHGRMNILYVDGHVDTQPILSTGNNVSSGAVGTANNSPNGALSNVSIDVDFP